jgi:hypothetical protein
MTSEDRTPAERAAFLRDRIASMILGACADGWNVCEVNNMCSPMHKRLAELIENVEYAFQLAERRGEKRGRLAGAALAKLTPDERTALGL